MCGSCWVSSRDQRGISGKLSSIGREKQTAASVLVSVAADHKPSDLKRCNLTILAFQRSESKIKVWAGLHSFWRFQGSINFGVFRGTQRCTQSLSPGLFLA